MSYPILILECFAAQCLLCSLVYRSKTFDVMPRLSEIAGLAFRSCRYLFRFYDDSLFISKNICYQAAVILTF